MSASSAARSITCSPLISAACRAACALLRLPLSVPVTNPAAFESARPPRRASSSGATVRDIVIDDEDRLVRLLVEVEVAVEQIPLPDRLAVVGWNAMFISHADDVGGQIEPL